MGRDCSEQGVSESRDFVEPGVSESREASDGLQGAKRPTDTETTMDRFVPTGPVPPTSVPIIASWPRLKREGRGVLDCPGRSGRRVLEVLTDVRAKAPVTKGSQDGRTYLFIHQGQSFCSPQHVGRLGVVTSTHLGPSKKTLIHIIADSVSFIVHDRL